MIKKSLLISKWTVSTPSRQQMNIRLYAVGLLFWIQKWRHNAHTRKHLAKLPYFLLRDIGLNEQQVRQHMQKKFWQ